MDIIVDESWRNYKNELCNYDLDLLYFPQRAFEFINSPTIVLNQSINDVGTTIWDAEIILAHEIDNILNKCNANVLELGAGTCLAGIVGYHLGNSLCIQELPHVIPWSQECCNQNNTIATYVGGLWGYDCISKITQNNTLKYNYIIMADVLYHSDNFNDLILTIKECCDINTNILISYEKRRKTLDDFINKMKQYFIIENIKVFQIISDITGKQTDIYLYKFLNIERKELNNA